MRLAAARTETESLFETLSNKSPVGLCIIQDGKFCYTNPTFQHNTGYSEDELLGRDSLELIVPEDRERVRENAVKMLKGESTLPHEFRVIHNDGSIHWVMESVAPVQYRGRPAILGNFVDITEHKQIQEQHKLFAEHSMDIIYCLRLEDEHYIYLSPAVERMLGYTAQEALALQTKDVLTQESYEKQKSEMLKDIENGVLQRTLQLEAVHKDGHIVPIEVHASFISDETGQPVEIVGIVRDITERKQQELEYKTIIRATVDGFLLVDMQGRFLEVNDAYSRLIGYGRDELLMMNISDIEVIEKPGETAARIARIREVGGDHFETHHKRKDGSIVDVEVSVNYLKVSGGRLVSFIRDITERKRAENTLQAEKNKLQSLIDAMDSTLTIQDTEYNIIYQNEKSRIASDGDHVGEKCYRAYEGREKVCDGCPVEEAFKDGKSHTSERRTVISGKVAFWENTANPIRDAGGRVVACLEVARDITERKHVEEELQKSEERYRQLAENAGEAILVVQDGMIRFSNPKGAELSGYSIEELTSRSFAEFIHLDDSDMVTDRYLKRLNGDTPPQTYDFRIIKRDGAIMWTELNAVLISWDNRPAVLCFMSDITERKQAEEELRESKERFQNLAEGTSDWIWEVDTDGVYTYANPKIKDLLGYEPKEVIGKTPFDLMPLDEAKSIAEKFRDIVESQRPFSGLENANLHKDGRLVVMESSGVPFFNADRQFCGYRGIDRDITERKKQEQALADELTRRRLLVDKSLDGIVVLDVDAKVVEANQRFAEMLGYTLEEVYKLHTWDWDKNFPPEQILEMGRNVDEKGLHLETKHTRKDGSVIDVDISISGIMYGGQKLIFCIGRDITERKRAEEALRQSEGNYRALFDSTVIGTIVINAETMKIMMANQAAAGMLGFSSGEEVIGVNPLDSVPPEDRERVRELLVNEFFKQDLRQTHEIRMITKDGREIWLSANGAMIMHEGRLAGLASFTDITEHKEAEEALNLQRAHFQQLFDNSPDAILMMDTNDRAIQANRGFEVLFGYSNEEVKGRSLIELIVPEVDVQEASDSLQRILGGEVVRKESVRRRKDGSLVDVSVLAYPIRSNGKLVGTYGIYSDITERKKMEEAIKHAAEEWRKTFDSISEPISIHDRDHKILRANKAFADIFNMKPRQILGRYCYELHKGNKPISGCPHKQTVATKKPAVAEFYESNLGKYLHESTSPIFDEKGEVVGTVHITRDVTEQKQQNEQLMMAERLASIGELAAGTAHELNNPLTSVIGFSQLLMEKDIPDDIREDLNLIYSEAQRAAGVTKNLLVFARKHAPTKQLNQINKIIEDVLKLRAYEHKVNGIEVKRQLAPDLPEIRVDYFQMQQVFLNIFINAEHFITEAHNRGTLTITTKKQNSNVRISIADDGPGIPRENLHRIFDPFFTTKEAGKGTGLGLSICHGIVAEHGGQIYAKNQQGKGATIFVELPINSH